MPFQVSRHAEPDTGPSSQQEALQFGKRNLSAGLLHFTSAVGDVRPPLAEQVLRCLEEIDSWEDSPCSDAWNGPPIEQGLKAPVSQPVYFVFLSMLRRYG